MTIKQEYFALQYVKSAGDLVAATEALDMPVSTGKRYLRNDEVQDYLAELNKDIEKVCKINKANIVQKHLDIHKSAMQGDPIKVGEEIYTKPDRSSANKALENVSTLMGYNAPSKVDVALDLSVWLTQQQNAQEIIDVETN